MPDKFTSIGLAIVGSWENWLEENCQPEIEFYKRMNYRSQIPKVIKQPDFLSETFDMVNLQIDYENLSTLPWPFSVNTLESQNHSSDNFFEMDSRYSGRRQFVQSSFPSLRTAEFQENPYHPSDSSNQFIEKSDSSYLVSKNLTPFKALNFDKKDVANEDENSENTNSKEFNNRNVTPKNNVFLDERTLDSLSVSKEIKVKEQIDQATKGHEENDRVSAENLWIKNRNRYSGNEEDATFLEKSTNLQYFGQTASDYGNPKWTSGEDKKQDNSRFSSVKGWGELAKTLNEKGPSGSSTELLSSDVNVPSIITTDFERNVPEVPEKTLSNGTYSTFNNPTAIGNKLNTINFPFIDMALETSEHSESEISLPDIEKTYEDLAAILRREYNRFYGP